ncbi:MAG: bifunctional molybdenum cofactor biosynthesis protein MoaC/MoaB [Leptolyngbya sp.]|nr:bifunctional molybdenum cofactor biosynthesis protein MoaC/MoaB [Candidatus Melainabacteria bacterium]
MRDISNKVNTLRTAVARARLKVSPSTIRLIREGGAPKGDPIPVARVAAIQAAKNTSQIIPYCHPMPVEFVGVEFQLDEDFIEILATVKAIYKTGVEMEALTAASVAALTIYDMLKMVDEVMQIESIVLVKKKGGKTDFRPLMDRDFKAGIVVLSDSCARGEKEDISGKLIMDRVELEGFDVSEYVLIPDEPADAQAQIKRLADELDVDLIITSGGTGISDRDTTPEAIKELLDRELPGIAETMRAYGQERNPYAMFSRSLVGVRGKTLIVTMPGSTGGVKDGMDALFPYVFHAFKMLRNEGHSDEIKPAKTDALQQKAKI